MAKRCEPYLTFHKLRQEKVSDVIEKHVQEKACRGKVNSGDVFEHVQQPVRDMPFSNAASSQNLANAASYCIEAVRDECVQLCIQLNCSQHTKSSLAS